MGRISASQGLVSGIDIEGTVNQLMKIEAKPKKILEQRTKIIETEQVAITELSALLMTVEYVIENLGKKDVYNKKEISTSSEAISASISGTPANGSHVFTPIRTAQAHQMLASGVGDDTAGLGGGEVSLRFGDHVERAASLEHLNGSEGFDRGWIQITDRSGTRGVVNLSTAQTIEDVLDAINANTYVNVVASADGDKIRITDMTGAEASNLIVQDINGGTTAQSLGLAGINAAESSVAGEDVMRLTRNTLLSELNDGNGVRVHKALRDMSYVLADGTTGTIDFSPLVSIGSEVQAEVNLGQMLDIINGAAPGKLTAEIAPDGDRLLLTDKTEGDKTLTLSALNGSSVLDDLGLTSNEPVDGQLTGRRLQGGLQTVLLSSLNGGQGFGQLGTIEINDLAGNAAQVDLSAAETLQDVVTTINAAEGINVTARVNNAKNGIELVDSTEYAVSKLTVSTVDDTETAEKLGLAFDDIKSRVNSGDMHLRFISNQTRLADLNGGRGVDFGKITLHDSQGRLDYLEIDADVVTVEDLIAEVNRLPNVSIYAELNETGDGVRLVDTAGGEGNLHVTQSGDRTTAADLHWLGEAVDTEVDDEPAQVLNGSSTVTIKMATFDSLDDLRKQINELDMGITASTFVDGSSRPFRLSLASEQVGRRGQMVVDLSGLGISAGEVSRAQDAMLAMGNPNQLGAQSVILTSETNTFYGAIPGVKLTVNEATGAPVTVQVASTDVDIVASLNTMKENYNKFRKKWTDYTKYDPETNKSSILTGDSTALRLDMDVSRFLSGTFRNTGDIKSLAELGLRLNDTGKMEFDEAKFRDLYGRDPEAVREFFTKEKKTTDESGKEKKEKVGFVAQYKALAESLTGRDTSLMATRYTALKRQVEQNTDKIEWYNEVLAKEEERLYNQFYNMESALAKMQADMYSLSSIQSISASDASMALLGGL